MGSQRLLGLALDPAETRSVCRRRDRLGEVPSVARPTAWKQFGLRLVMSRDAEWSTQLHDLGEARPPAAPPHLRPLAAWESNRETALTSARLAHTPAASSSDKPLPGLTTPLRSGLEPGPKVTGSA
jgi:hypothetical protein